MTPNEIRDFSWYSGGLPWLQKRTIMLGRSGSQSYGTNLPTSDIDLRGVAIAPRECYLGFLTTFEQAETKTPIDCTVYELRKFFKLAADNNPNIIETLFLDPSDIVSTSHEWERVREAAPLFLSKKARHTFSGYAYSQLKRIKSHRNWLLNPLETAPVRADYGLPEGEPTLGKEQLGLVESRIKKHTDTLGGRGLTKDVVIDADEALVGFVVGEMNLARDLIPIILAERRYASACREWQSYMTWKAERNKMRQDLEVRFGYDTKHAMHLVRLLRMGVEILTGKGVLVRRPDAEELLAIRAGAWSFDRLEEYAISVDAEMEAAYKTSTLPHAADRKELDRILVKILTDFLF